MLHPGATDHQVKWVDQRSDHQPAGIRGNLGGQTTRRFFLERRLKVMGVYGETSGDRD